MLVTGWQSIDGNWYYFAKGGAMQTGWQKLGTKWYYFDGEGILATGWKQIGSKWYHFADGGAASEGWQKLGDKWYYFGQGFAMVTGWQKLGSSWYYFASGGAMQTGWQKVGTSWYFFAGDGIMTTGWKQLSGKWYYFSDDGAMTTGWQTIGGKRYYMGANGVMTTGWQKIDGKWYYMGTNGIMTTGWQKVGDKWYYMNTSGVMLTGWQTISGKRYYLNADGIMATGWLEYNGQWYYMGEYGAMATGWQKVGTKWYYMNASGVMLTGWQTIDGKRYYLGANGAMATGWLELNGKWYYFASGVMATGWQKIGSNWYYFQSSGVMVSNTTMTIDGKPYTFDANGVWVPEPVPAMHYVDSEVDADIYIPCYIYVETDDNAKYLRMYSGSTVLRTWSLSDADEYEYYDDEGTMGWTVAYTFTSAGSKSVTFKASHDGSEYGTGASCTVQVLAEPKVYSVSVSNAMVNSQATLTVETDLRANYLSMYNASGSRLATWYYSDVDYSVPSDDRLRWVIPYTFTSAGTQSYTFKTGVDNVHYGTGFTKSITVSAAPAPVTTTYRALCIGQADYRYDSQNNRASGSYSWWPDLPICSKDADAVATMLRGTKQSYTATVRYNRSASQILSDISTAFSGATDNDVSLFYYSGHGFGDVEPTSDRYTYQGALCGVNVVAETHTDVVTTAQLANALSKVKGKVIVIIDACFSGAAISTKSAVIDSRLNRYNQAIVDAFSGYTLDYELDIPEFAYANSGELATNKFLVITASSYYETSLANGLTPLSLFTSELLYAAGMTISGTTASYSGSSMPADTNPRDNNLTLKECYDYTKREIQDLCDEYNDYYGLTSGDEDYFQQTVLCYGTSGEVLFSR